MAVSIEQAAVNALVTYLKTRLSDVEISGKWPSPDKQLPPKAITVLKIGKREEEKLEPAVVAVAELTPPDPILKSYTWRVKRVVQSIQLDVWSCYEAVRDDIQARLDDALNQGPNVTLGAALDRDDIRDGLMLALGDGHFGYADFEFDGPEINDVPEGAQRDEFRSTQLGALSAVLTVTKTQPRMAQLSLRETADGQTDTYSP